MTLAEIRDVLLRELAARALADGEFSDGAREALLKRVGFPLVRRNLRRGDQIRWRYNLLYASEERLVVERLDERQILFESPRIAIELVEFCKAVINGEALDP